MGILYRWSGSYIYANIKRILPRCNFFAFTLLLYTLLPASLFCAFDRFPQPAGCTAGSLAALFLPKPENLLCNPASLASIGRFQSLLFYSPSPFGLKQLSCGGMMIVIPEGGMTGALSVTHYGDQVYRELTGTYSQALLLSEDLSLGININFNSLRIVRYGSASAIGLDFSAACKITDIVRWGFSILNFNGPSIGSSSERLPRWYVTGISVETASFAMINLLLMKDLHYPLSVRAGVDLNPVEGVTFRCGVSQNPSRLSGGFELRYHEVAVTYGVVTHVELGLTHTIGLEVAY
jgi:hypothetical protein